MSRFYINGAIVSEERQTAVLAYEERQKAALERALPRDFQWETYLMYHPDLRANGIATETLAKQVRFTAVGHLFAGWRGGSNVRGGRGDWSYRTGCTCSRAWKCVLHPLLEDFFAVPLGAGRGCEPGTDSERVWMQHYIKQGRAEGRVYKRLRVLLRYTACTGALAPSSPVSACAQAAIVMACRGILCAVELLGCNSNLGCNWPAIGTNNGVLPH